jgi:hypothetical protein
VEIEQQSSDCNVDLVTLPAACDVDMRSRKAVCTGMVTKYTDTVFDRYVICVGAGIA